MVNRLTTGRKRSAGSVRIISGKWRGTLLKVPQVASLRPTADRLKETLFNWIAGHTQDSCCLDLFAGSGALGFESLSRGARHVTFVERHGKTAAALHAAVAALEADDQTQIFAADALRLLRTKALKKCYDLIFVDPPFQTQEQVLSKLFVALPAQMHVGSLLYVESSCHNQMPELPPSFELSNQSRVGDVCGRLFIYRR